MKNRRIVSLLLSFVMVLGMLPVIQWEIPEAKVEVEAAETVDYRKNPPKVFVYESGSSVLEGMQPIVKQAPAYFIFGLWHYSGGYWAQTRNSKAGYSLS